MSLAAPLRQALWILLVALLSAALAAFIHPKRPGWSGEAMGPDQISAAELAAWHELPLLVDARARKHYEKEHISGAMLLNEDEWDELLPAVLSAWQPGQRIVVYCDSMGCDASQHVAQRLREAGVGPVHVLHGGWAAWKESAR